MKINIMDDKITARIGQPRPENGEDRTVALAFIDEAEFLRRIPVSRRTLFSWRAAGKIPTVKIGRRSLYHWESVVAALLRHQRGGSL